MDRRDDDHLPDDLREIADGIRQSRVEPTPLQLDGLKQRARRQAERRIGSTARWRKKLLAGILALGLMLSSTTGVVLAARSTGTSTDPRPSFEALWNWLQQPKKDSAKSQYCDDHDDSDSDTARDRDTDSDCDNSDSD